MAILSNLLAFLGGVFVGALGKFGADWLTDWRRQWQRTRQRNQIFAQVEASMPELLAEMREDVLGDISRMKREFLPCALEIARSIRPDGTTFFYDPEKHVGLRGKLAILESHGFIEKLTIADIPLYQMTEEFVALIKQSATDTREL